MALSAQNQSTSYVNLYYSIVQRAATRYFKEYYNSGEYQMHICACTRATHTTHAHVLARVRHTHPRKRARGTHPRRRRHRRRQRRDATTTMTTTAEASDSPRRARITRSFVSPNRALPPSLALPRILFPVTCDRRRVTGHLCVARPRFAKTRRHRARRVRAVSNFPALPSSRFPPRRSLALRVLTRKHIVAAAVSRRRIEARLKKKRPV